MEGGFAGGRSGDTPRTAPTADAASAVTLKHAPRKQTLLFHPPHPMYLFTLACPKQYVSEAVGAISDAPLRAVDVPAAVAVCSLLHQRYAEFGEQIAPALAKVGKQ